MRPLIVTAHLATPLAGDPPQLDSLLEFANNSQAPRFKALRRAGMPHERLERGMPAPKLGEIPIPLVREWLGQWLVSRCSSPILPVCASTPVAGPTTAEGVAYTNKRLSAAENGLLLDENERKVVSTGTGWTKSYRLPLRIRCVPCVRWFCVGDGREIFLALNQRLHAIGKKPSQGYGRVSRWEVSDVRADYSWFAPGPKGVLVLMRILPVVPEAVDSTAKLPEEMVGYRKTFGACCTPYWHPERFTEVVVPC